MIKTEKPPVQTIEEEINDLFEVSVVDMPTSIVYDQASPVDVKIHKSNRFLRQQQEEARWSVE